MSKKNIYENSNIADFHIPRWNELPNLDLYLDQLVCLLEQYLSNYIKNNDEKNKEEKIITKTMINNYVKHNIIKAPIKKKYSKEHIAYLFVVCILKQVYSINDIAELINLALKTVSIEKAYDQFCVELEKAINTTFAGEKYDVKNSITKEQYILQNVVQSFANKLYVKMLYLNA